MKQIADIQSIVIMGVSGSGKTTIGFALAQRTGSEFCDADRLHPASNVAKMSTGQPLNDQDRLPWLRLVGQHMKDMESSHRRTVVACSALKRSYRDILREYSPDAFFVCLDGPPTVFQTRVDARNHEFMQPSLLASQFAILEPLDDEELGAKVSADLSPLEILDRILADVGWLNGESESRRDEAQ